MKSTPLIPRKHASRKDESIQLTKLGFETKRLLKKRIIHFHILRILFLHDDIKFPFSPELPTRKKHFAMLYKVWKFEMGNYKKISVEAASVLHKS